MSLLKTLRFLLMLWGLTVNFVAMAASADTDFNPATFGASFHHGIAVVEGIKLHYVEGGKGTPILLIPGWPESWYAWRFVMPELIAAGHRVIALDLRGMGDSDHPMNGYDSRTVAKEIHGFVEVMGLAREGSLDVAAHDVGAWMAYAYAADWGGDVRRLILMEAALPGITPPPVGTPNDMANLRSWHFAFNRLPDLPEVLVQGHERAYLGWLFSQKSAKPWVFTPEALDEYVRVFSQPGGARSAFAYYRAAFSEGGLLQNQDRSKAQLTLPILTMGGQYSVGDLLEKTMKRVATDVQGVQLAGCGHFVLEECSKDVANHITNFVKPR